MTKPDCPLYLAMVNDGIIVDPVFLVLHCPACSTQHVDRGEWAERPHRTHLCEVCGHQWRPFEYTTIGVDAL